MDLVGSNDSGTLSQPLTPSPAAVSGATPSITLTVGPPATDPRPNDNTPTSLAVRGGTVSGAMMHYSVELHNNGQEEQALAAAEDAVKILKALVQTNPAEFEAQLARALTTYAAMLHEKGQVTEALAANEEAGRIFQSLGQTGRTEHKLDHAIALSNYSLYLESAGKMEDALNANAKCVILFKSLHQDGHEPPSMLLAVTLFTYSCRLADTHRSELVLTPAQESVEIFNKMVQDNPGEHEAFAVPALLHYSCSLSNRDKNEDALTAAQECVKLVKTLRPGREAYMAMLPAALFAYSRSLSDCGKKREASVAEAERLQVLHVSKSASSDEYKNILCQCSECLKYLYKREREVIAPAEDMVVQLREALHLPALPDPQTADLAALLLDHQMHLDNADKKAKAIAAFEASVQVYGGLHATHPEQHQDASRNALHQLLQRLDGGATHENATANPDSFV